MAKSSEEGASTVDAGSPLSSEERRTRRALSDAYAFIRSAETSKTLGTITLDELIVEQIYLLDSDSVDSDPGSEGDSGKPGFGGPPSLVTSVMGRLQRLEELEETLFNSNSGVIPSLKKAEKFEESSPEDSED